jgi:hypothetical protein
VKSGAAPSLANRGERTSATATVLHQAVKPGATPTVLRTGEKSSTAATNRTVQASTTRAALKNVAQPGPTNPSPETGEKTGAKAIFQGAGGSIRMPRQGVKPGGKPTQLNTGRKAISTASDGAVRPTATPTTRHKVARPDATSPLLEKREGTGARVIVQRAAGTTSVPQAVKPDAPSSAGKRAEKAGADTPKLFEAAKGGFDATSKPQGQKTHGKSISPQKLAGKTDVDVKLRQEDQKPHVKSSSPRKIAANRRNSRRSTGPKTKEGKSHSRWNSHKHGILANALLVTDGPGAENVAEFYELLDGLRHDYKPKGKAEQLSVEEIAICEWKKIRAYRCEAGLIRRGFVIECAEPALEIQTMKAVLGRDEADERDRELKAITDHLSVPLCGRLELLLRYEAAIQKKESFAITQLERLQAARKGKPVPAPVKVQLSTN